MKVLIASSATGGHLYPALAVAEGIRARDANARILFASAEWEIARGIVENAGYEQVFIKVSGFDRKNPLNNVKTLRELARSSAVIKKLLREFRPDVVLGTGGHVAGPVVRCAKRAGFRTLIQEQNALPGMANKLAARYADQIFIAFEDTAQYFKEKAKLTVSGNPVRAAFAEAAARRTELRERLGVDANAFCVLIFGGSQGSGVINLAAADAVRRLADTDGIRLIVVTGKEYFAGFCEEVAPGKGTLPENLLLLPYADAIYELFAAADLIVSRAGAMAVSELSASGRASILIPSPNVTNNHQYYNAKKLAEVGAAILLDEERLGAGGLMAEILRLADKPHTVSEMSRHASELARPDAVKVIVDAIFGKQ